MHTVHSYAAWGDGKVRRLCCSCWRAAAFRPSLDYLLAFCWFTLAPPASGCGTGGAPHSGPGSHRPCVPVASASMQVVAWLGRLGRWTSPLSVARLLATMVGCRAHGPALCAFLVVL
jgi:hypothetical protein